MGTAEKLREKIDPARIPAHVAIIMDGNGRWAKQHGEHRVVGHANGVRSVREALVGATEIGIGHLHCMLSARRIGTGRRMKWMR